AHPSSDRGTHMTPPPTTAVPPAVPTLAPAVLATAPQPTPEPAIDPVPKGTGERVALALFIAVPFAALVAAVPVAWGWGLGWSDIVIALVMYVISGLGITVGFHRLFTHGSFKAARGLRAALAVAGSLAIEDPVVRWVADHRRHHAF